MGKPTGFMETARQLPDRRAVEERILDWLEVYGPFPEHALKAKAAPAPAALTNTSWAKRC
ncbi:MAG: hypothetical protein NTW87_24265 [Planctomycetota bacterium]|nr:hypothetical protein [Planctomycetota bacterium]